MKIFLLSLVVVLLTACSKQLVYDAIHERERQECLKQGSSDCPRAESYDKYKSQREEVIQVKDIEEYK